MKIMFGIGRNFRNISSDCGLLIGVTDTVAYSTMMIAASVAAADSSVNDSKLQQMLHRLLMGCDKPELYFGFYGALTIFLCFAMLFYVSDLLVDGAMKRSSGDLMPALMAKCILLTFLMTLVAFGSAWILPLVLLDSAKIVLICFLWQEFKREEEACGIREYMQTVQLFTVVTELARIQYEDETVVTKSTEIVEYVD